MTHDELVQLNMGNGMLIGLTNGQVAIVDADDYQWLVSYKWTAHYDEKMAGFYAVTNTPCDENGKRRFIRMHREIMAASNGEQVDHGNHKTLDNRRRNLRLVSGCGNMMNKILYKNSSSGVCGVSWHKRDKKWSAHIRINGKMIGLGSYVNKADAISARQAANVKYGFHENHGECWAEVEGRGDLTKEEQ